MGNIGIFCLFCSILFLNHTKQVYNLVNTVNRHPYTHDRSQELYRPVQKASLCLFDTTASSPWKEPLTFHRKPFFVFIVLSPTWVFFHIALQSCCLFLKYVFWMCLNLQVLSLSTDDLSVEEFPDSLDFADCVVVILFFSLFSANCPWIERLDETQSQISCQCGVLFFHQDAHTDCSPALLLWDTFPHNIVTENRNHFIVPRDCVGHEFKQVSLENSSLPREAPIWWMGWCQDSAIAPFACLTVEMVGRLHLTGHLLHSMTFQTSWSHLHCLSSRAVSVLPWGHNSKLEDITVKPPQ